MQTKFVILVLGVLLVAVPSPCFALWGIAPVTKAEAEKKGVEVRVKTAGLKDVRVELEFKIDGELKDFSRVEMRFDDVVTASLKEDRSKPGRVVVDFSADRARLDKINLWIFVPGHLGGTIYEIRPSDFVEMKKDK
jgi:hypothetical protein